MTRSRIAIFEGYVAPRSMSRYGAPIFSNPQNRQPVKRMSRYGAPLFVDPRSMVPNPRYGGPIFSNPQSTERMSMYGKTKPTKRKKMRTTPKMKKAQARMKRAAKICSRRRKGTYRGCMRKQLRKGK